MMEIDKKVGAMRIEKMVKDGSNSFIETLEMMEQKNFACIKNIDKGRFGSVYELKHDDKDEKIAAKISVASKVSVGDKIIWRSLHHGNIVPLLSSFYFESTNTYVFMMKKYESTLFNLIEDITFRNDPKAFKRSISYLKGVVEAVSYMHSHGICHADIKTNNILIDEFDNSLICDFGFAQKPLLLIEKYGVPVKYCPPESKVTPHGRTLVDGFQLDRYSVGILALEIFTHHSLNRTVVEKHPVKFEWSHDVYPILYDILQPRRFKVLVETQCMTSNISSTSVQNLLDTIKSLIRIDPSKRTTLLNVSEFRIFGGRKEGSLEDGIWSRKSTPEELEIMIGLSAPNPLLTVQDLIDERKRYALSKASEEDIFESTETRLIKGKGNKEPVPEFDDVEFQTKEKEVHLSGCDRTRRQALCDWFRKRSAWIRNVFGACLRKKSRK